MAVAAAQSHAEREPDLKDAAGLRSAIGSSFAEGIEAAAKVCDANMGPQHTDDLWVKGSNTACYELARKIRALGSAPSSTTRKDEYFWLIERDGPQYATGHVATHERWTADPYKAVRFPTEAAARFVDAGLRLWEDYEGAQHNGSRAVEHCFTKLVAT